MEKIERRGFFRGVLGILAAPFASKAIENSQDRYIIGELQEFIPGEMIRAVGLSDVGGLATKAESIMLTNPTTEELIDGMKKVDRIFEEINDSNFKLVAPTSQDIGNVTAETPSTGQLETFLGERGVAPEFPLDILAPGDEKDYVAYTIPNYGRIPDKMVTLDYPICIGDRNHNDYGFEESKLESSLDKLTEEEIAHIRNQLLTKSPRIYWDSVAGEHKEYEEFPADAKLEWDGMKWFPVTDIYLNKETLQDIQKWGDAELNPPLSSDEVARGGSLGVCNININLGVQFIVGENGVYGYPPHVDDKYELNLYSIETENNII